VLVETTHPGNIGASARALKTMGLRRIHLVNPSRFPCVEATAMASGADDLLVNAVICKNLEEALSGCGLVVGTSARLRAIPWPVLDPRACGQRAAQAAVHGEVAIVFGREHSGLTNDELELCHAMVRIPAAPDFSSLNLAAAAQILAYEIRHSALDHEAAASEPQRQDSPPATLEQMQELYTHLERVMTEVGFYDPAKPRRLMRRLRRLFNRMELDQNEMNILRGFLAAVEDKLGKPR
jgi:tRNA (cytidine32/uridine32-2'-O)-methyltransferase